MSNDSGVVIARQNIATPTYSASFNFSAISFTRFWIKALSNNPKHALQSDGQTVGARGGVKTFRVGVAAPRVGVTFSKVGVVALKVGVAAPRVGVTFSKVGVVALKVGVAFSKVGMAFSNVGVAGLEVWGSSLIRFGMDSEHCFRWFTSQSAIRATFAESFAEEWEIEFDCELGRAAASDSTVCLAVVRCSDCGSGGI